MSHLRISHIAPAIAVILLGSSNLSWAAGSDDLDPRVLLEQTTDSSGRCGQGSGSGADACCGTSFQAEPGSVSSQGAKNLCFGSQSISRVSNSAAGSNAAQSVTVPPVTYGQPVGGGGGASAAASPAIYSGSGSSEPIGSSFFGGGGGGGSGSNVGAPGPIAGAGLPFLLVAGAYALVRRRRTRA